MIDASLVRKVVEAMSESDRAIWRIELYKASGRELCKGGERW